MEPEPGGLTQVATVPRASASAEPRRRVLIVVGTFAPAMCADMHRARMLCHELPALGWDVEVLTPDTSYQRPDVIEPGAERFFPAGLVVHRAPPWCTRVFRWLRINNQGWRGFWPMYRLGSRLLAKRKFDLVYFSTTSFILFCLGRLWRVRRGVPYVLDFHDPWVRHETKYITTTRRWKWRMTHFLARYLERFAVRRAAGLVCVSSRYVDDMAARYASDAPEWLRTGRAATIPFAGSRRDLDQLEPGKHANRRGEAARTLRIAYVGAGGSFMQLSLRTLCESLARLKRNAPRLTEGLRIDMYGTIALWRPGDALPMQEIAQQCGVDDMVHEHPQRKTYLESLEIADAADGLLVLGVDDAGYIPSKLFGYLLFGKPVLACFHDESPAAKLLRAQPDLGHMITFGGAVALEPGQIDATVSKFLNAVAEGHRHDRSTAIAEFLAPAMAAKHAQLFECCLERRAS